MTQTTPSMPARRAYNHLLTVIANLQNAVAITDVDKTHPIYVQCLASALTLSQHATYLIALAAADLFPLFVPPPAPTAPPVLPQDPTTACTERSPS